MVSSRAKLTGLWMTSSMPLAQHSSTLALFVQEVIATTLTGSIFSNSLPIACLSMFSSLHDSSYFFWNSRMCSVAQYPSMIGMFISMKINLMPLPQLHRLLLFLFSVNFSTAQAPLLAVSHSSFNLLFNSMVKGTKLKGLSSTHKMVFEHEHFGASLTSVNLRTGIKIASSILCFVSSVNSEPTTTTFLLYSQKSIPSAFVTFSSFSEIDLSNCQSSSVAED